MREQMNDFFEALEGLFLEKDKEAFLEIKADLSREIKVRMAEGESCEAILKALGSPQEIAEAYYEDQRLEKAMKAKQDIIAGEDLVREYKMKRNSCLKRWMIKLGKLFLFLFQILLLVTSFYFLMIVLYYLIYEQVIMWGAVTSSLFSLCFVIVLKKPEQVRKRLFLVYFVGIVSFLCNLFLVFNHSWVYQGQFLTRDIELKANAIESLNVSSTYPVDISMIQLSENETARVEIKGHIRKQDQKQLFSMSSSKMNLTIGHPRFFDWSQSMGKVEVVFYLPENTKHKSLRFNLEQGEVTLNHTYAEKINLKMKKGRISITDVYSKAIQINSQSSDVSVHQFFSELAIKNKVGKTILSDGQGKIRVVTDSGVIKVLSTMSEKMELNNIEGKNIVSSGAIQRLTARNMKGTTIIEKQAGDTSIKNGSGKLVLTDLTGGLSVENDSGTVIVSQQVPLEATVKSASGHVKWVQSQDVVSRFDLSSTFGEITNQFKEQTKDEANTINISTEKGNIMVLKKELEGKS